LSLNYIRDNLNKDIYLSNSLGGGGTTSQPQQSMKISFEEITELNEQDWKKMLAGAKEIKYPSGSTILQEGFPNSGLYRIKSGKVKIQRKINKKVLRKKKIKIPKDTHIPNAARTFSSSLENSSLVNYTSFSPFPINTNRRIEIDSSSQEQKKKFIFPSKFPVNFINSKFKFYSNFK